MRISSFDDLLRVARQQPEPQRLLFVFARAELPDNSSAEQRAAFHAGHGGTLAPFMSVDKAADELDTFNTLLEESRGGVMVLLGQWAQHIVTLRGGAAEFMSGVHWLYKVHLMFGMTLFVVFPFSRLVHVWSGFAAVGYLTRPYQVIR